MSTFALLLRGASVRTLEAVVSIVAGIITLPLLLNALGVETYGIWVLIGSVTALFYLLDLGFASAVTRQVAAAIAERDTRRINQIVTNALAIYSALALLILLLVTLAALYYRPDLGGVITPAQFAWVLWLFGATLALEFPAKAFSGLASGFLRHDLVAAYRIVLRVLSTALLAALLWGGWGLVAVALLNAVMGVIAALAFVAVARHVFAELRLHRDYLDKATALHLYRYSAWAFGVDLNAILKQRLDVFFVGATLSLGAVAFYYVAVRVVEYTSELLYKMLNLITPVLTAHQARGDTAALVGDISLFTRINIYVAWVSLCGWWLVGELILQLWMGADFPARDTLQVVLILLLGRLAGVISNGFTSALYAINAHRWLVWIGLGETLLSVALLLLLWGLASAGVLAQVTLLAVAWAMTLPLLLGRLIAVPWAFIYAQRATDAQFRQIPLIPFLGMSLRPLLLWLVPLAMALGPLYRDAPYTGAQTLLLGGLAVIALGVFAALELTARERALVARLLRRARNLTN